MLGAPSNTVSEPEDSAEPNDQHVAASAAASARVTATEESTVADADGTGDDAFIAGGNEVAAIEPDDSSSSDGFSDEYEDDEYEDGGDAGGPHTTSLEHRPLLRPGFRVLAVFGVVAALALGVMSRHLDSGRLSLGPGPTSDVVELFVGTPTDPEFGQHGTFLVTTVEVSELTWSELAYDYFWPSSDEIILEETSSPGTGRFAATRQMVASKRAAFYQAAKYTGNTDLLSAPSGVEVLEVSPGSAAETSGLVPGDVIVEVNGAAVPDANSLIAALTSLAGKQATLTVTTGTTGREVDVTVPAGARLGIEVTDHYQDDTALDVDMQQVGGSSGGLMMTLAFIDALSPGDLSANMTLAGTGVIQSDASIGRISGVEHKVAGAKNAGASVFFAPAENFAIARTHASEGLQVVEVAYVQDAIDWLCVNGATDKVCEK